MGYKTFRIYPDGRHLRYDVYIWDTKKEMQKHNRHLSVPNYKAMCVCHKLIRVSNGVTVTSRSIGELHFHKKNIGAFVVSHEILHATFGWARKIKMDFGHVQNDNATHAHPNEEALCDAQGRMMRQFVKKAVELGYYPE